MHHAQKTAQATRTVMATKNVAIMVTQILSLYIGTLHHQKYFDECSLFRLQLFLRCTINSQTFPHFTQIGCGHSCMAIVKDPGVELLGGEDAPEAPLDPNAPQIRVSLKS